MTKEIHRLLELGEPILPTDERLTMKLDWEPISKSNTHRPGDKITLAHHPHRRREKVTLEGEQTERIYSIDDFACAAMAGMISDCRVVEDRMKKEPGGQRFTIYDVTAEMAYEYAHAMKRARDGEPAREVIQKGAV